MNDDKRQLPLFGTLSDDREPPGQIRPSTDVTAFGVAAGWTGEAERAVLRVASRRRSFTTDEVWATGMVPPPEPRALGNVLKRAAALGLIARTDRFVPTKRKSRHGAPVAVWRSQIKRNTRS